MMEGKTIVWFAWKNESTSLTPDQVRNWWKHMLMVIMQMLIYVDIYIDMNLKVDYGLDL